MTGEADQDKPGQPAPDMGLLPIYPDEPEEGADQDKPGQKGKKEALSDAEIVDLLGDMYAEAFELTARWYAKVDHYHYAEDRARRRGQAIARLLKHHGWSNDDVLLYADLAIGGVSDIAMLNKLRQDQADGKGAAATKAIGPGGDDASGSAPAKKKSAPAEVKEAPV